MQVTAIKAQVKRAGRYSIFVDGKYSFSLSDTALLDSKLVSGQELTREELGKLKQLSDDDKLWSKILNYTALRPRSVWEVEQYLKRHHSPAPQVQEILNKLSKLDMLNDKAFAHSWVESRRLLKPTSRRKLELELKQKRIADEIIREVLAEDAPDERALLRELIAKKTKQAKFQDKTKLMQYLARQGFGYDDIKSVLSEDEA